MAGHSVLTPALDDKYCSIDPIKRIRNKFKLAVGRPVAAEYPKDDLWVRMAKDHPGIVAPEVLYNTDHCLMVSGRAKTIFRDYLGKSAEYLAFKLRDHRGKPVAGFGFFVNPLGTVDCIDRKRTVGDASFITPGEYSAIHELHLEPRKIPRDAHLFRLESSPTTTVVSKQLRRALEKAKITGIKYWELGEHIPFLGL